jgi:metacaspase-1
MQRYILLIILIIFTVNQAAGSRKLALIIAISDYPIESGWTRINSTNDVGLIIKALNYQGFEREHIVVLTNEQATKAGIVASFEHLISEAQQGDVVYFHFSGHGQQIMDDNGDEVDGYDEALVPYDAGMHYKYCAAKGANHLRDDLLGELLDQIRTKIGKKGDLIAVLDACHSGTATRGIGQSRGTPVRFESTGYKPDSKGIAIQKQGFYEGVQTEEHAPIVVISASSATELNYEFVYDQTGYGSLSFAFSKVLSTLQADATYRSMFSKVQQEMSWMVPRQNPQIEGDIDRQLFAGKIAEHMPYMRVKLWRDERHVVLDAGMLNGLQENSIVELYVAGTQDKMNTDALASGRVVNSQLAQSLVELDMPIEKNNAISSWVFIKESGIGAEAYGLALSDQLPPEMRALITQEFNTYELIAMNAKYPHISIDITAGPLTRLEVISRDDRNIYSTDLHGKSEVELLEGIANGIRRYIQADLLRKLAVDNSSIAVSFEIIPVQLDEQYREVSRGSYTASYNRFGQLVFEGGTYFRLRLKNHGNRQAYYSLLSIQSNNSINILVPEKDSEGRPYRSAADCKIAAGETEELRAIFYFTEPFGSEVFKLIASNRPLNLDQVIQTRGQYQDKMMLNPIELLFADSFDMLRSGGNHRLPPEYINIYTVVFDVIEGEERGGY